MLIENLKKFVYPVCNIALQAGKILKKYYNSESKILLKKDNSPITQADLESDQLIKNLLIKLDMNIPILTEESLVDWKIRKEWKTYWLVDPLDGTKEFIKQNDEFTINIALIENNRPVLGVIYAPALEVIYFSYQNGGSYKINIEENKKIENYLENSIKLQSSYKTKNDSIIVIYSRSHPDNELELWLKNNIKKYDLIQRGSSLKFCNIAEGTADLYPRFKPTSEWDIAAGHIILNEAGGKIETIDKKEMLYNLKEDVINPHFIASSKLEL